MGGRGLEPGMCARVYTCVPGREVWLGVCLLVAGPVAPTEVRNQRLLGM